MLGKPDQPRGPDGKWVPRRGRLAAVALVGGLGMAGVGGFGSGGGAGIAGSTGAAGSSTIRIKVDKGSTAARKGNRTAAWKRMGLRRVRKSRMDEAVECAANSYGDVQRFFLRNSCRSLKRIYVVLGNGTDTIKVTVSWVRMPSSSTASELRSLADTHGTGNIRALTGEKFTGLNYDSRPHKRTTVVIAETDPLAGSPSHEFLDGLAAVAVQLPPPR